MIRQAAVGCKPLLGAAASLVCCVRIEDHRLLAYLNFAVLEAAGTLVAVQDCTGSGLPCFDKPEGARDRAFAKQALAIAQYHRKTPDAQRINEIVPEQGLSRSPLPWIWISPPSCALSLRASAATFPLSRWELFQVTLSSVHEATYFSRVLRAVAFSSAGSVALGQEAANIS